ncbi:MAG: GDP-mannose 4,6-dehydratase [Gemmatimonadota bacterium]|nr:GDP-mannose 4,6-dehydratase [Gemmatimonadota bacterium]
MAGVGETDRTMRVLVTGAAGFIGSHLCERLLKDGHSVWGVDNFDDFYDPAIKRRNISISLGHTQMHLVEGDVRDSVLLDGLFGSIPFDLVVHLAARPGVRPSIREPGLCYDVNVTGTLRLLEAMRRHRVSRFVFASSSSVYGDDAALPFAEDRPACNPLSPYAASKRSGELMCHSWHKSWGLSVYCLRLFSVYGPRQRPDLAISGFVALLREGKPLPVHGGPATGRDYTHVDDVVEGICRSAANLRVLPANAPVFRILNVGHGRTVHTTELAETLGGVLGVRARMSRRPERVGDVPVTLADTTLLEKELGYRPRVELSDGLIRYVEWLNEVESIDPAAVPVGSS